MFTFVSADGISLQVEDAVALQLHPLIDKTKTGTVVQLPYTSGKIISLVINYCKTMLESSMSNDAQYFKKFDDVTLFNLIQAAHHFKIKSLMDQTCQTLLDRVRGNSSSKMMQKFNEDQEYAHALKRPKRDPGSNRLRSHRREAFIISSDGLDVHDLQIDFTVTMKALVKKEDEEFNKYVADFLGLSDFLVMEDCMKRIKRICVTLAPKERSSVYLGNSTDLSMTTNIKKLGRAITLIQYAISKDRGLADLLSSEVASRLVLILKNIDLFDFKYMAAHILSLLDFDKCGDVIKEAFPVLLKAICNDLPQLADEAAFMLARLAYSSSNWIKVSHFGHVKKAVTKYKELDPASNLTMFLVFVCRGHDLSSSDKVKVVLPILEDLFFSIKGNSFAVTPVNRACYALSYLTFATCVVVKNRTCERLVEFTSHKSISLSGSALGVIGNIVRWGSPQQIQSLVKDCKLMRCLGQKVLCSSFKKFQMEGCRIISNIAARCEILIEDMDKADLTHLLSNLLEADESDVKMEAAWAMFNMHYNVKYKHENIDNYEKDIVMSNASEINLEVEQERSGLATSDNEVEKEREVGNAELKASSTVDQPRKSERKSKEAIWMKDFRIEAKMGKEKKDE